jgi:uncharacterized coiled-coil protein SlyX
MDPIIITLQEMLAHQQREIETLSDELYAQQKEIASRRAQMVMLGSKVQTMEANEGNPTGDREPPPPHY